MYTLSDFEIVERKEVLGSWCEHRSLETCNDLFCSECGAHRPQPRVEEYTYEDLSKFPSYLKPYLLEWDPSEWSLSQWLMESHGGRMELTPDVDMWCDFEGDRLFVGMYVGSADKYDGDVFVSKPVPKDYLSEWGLKPEILLYTYWC